MHARYRLVWLLFFSLFVSEQAAADFDQTHGAWDSLLKKHVVWINGGTGSQVRYAALKEDRAQLRSYLDQVSTVSETEFRGWSKSQQLAFLINAYNAFTVELILTRYPDIESIRDFGIVFNNPWKKKFFSLLGRERHLDNIEHDMIRARGVYNDPRIHVACVCASIGCPGLRNEAYVAERLDAQLDDGMRRFLSDRTRNRYDAAARVLFVSSIFDWYHGDFEEGHLGFREVDDVFAKYADSLTDSVEGREVLRAKRALIRYLDYDWKLNDVR